MIPLSRPRPASINIFAVGFLAAALILFVAGLLNLPGELAFLQRLYPSITWSRDLVIVWISAWLSIALIPIAMVWLSAVRFARWMVAIMALYKLAGVAGFVVIFVRGGTLPFYTVGLLLLNVLAAAMLFTPASNRWFAGKGGVEPAIFE